jgi:hypothetical protein
MYHCALFECEVQNAFDKMESPESDKDIAYHWFRLQQAFVREMWRHLLLDQEVNLQEVRRYLVCIHKNGQVFKTLSPNGKERVLMWQKLANYTTLKIFRFRQKR